MLFTKPIDQITYDDVVRFCDQHNREGFNLDYKRELPPNNATLAKWIAAFANTYGGLLIIGINASDGLPELPFEGFNFDSSISYDEKIISVILSNIHQPVFPEVKVCDPVNGKTFIVIRIPESGLSPHIVGDKIRIYVRTGELSNPIDEISWEKAEWLKLRRKKSIDLRESLIKESELFYKQAFFNKHQIGILGDIQYPCVLTLKILPLFPQGQLTPFTNLLDDNRYIRIDNSHPYVFPPSTGHFESVQNGVQILNYTQNRNPGPLTTGGYTNDDFSFVYLNNLGAYVYKEKLGHVDQDGNCLFNFFKLVERLYQFLKSSFQYFTELHYWGSLFLVVELKRLRAYSISSPSMSDASSIIRIPTNNLKWQRNFTLKELELNRNDISAELLADISWSLGLERFRLEQIKEFLLAQPYYQ